MAESVRYRNEETNDTESIRFQNGRQFVCVDKEQLLNRIKQNPRQIAKSVYSTNEGRSEYITRCNPVS